MNYDPNYRTNQWQPAQRPEWVQRINDEGKYLDIKSIVPLDEDSLISCVRKNTGLSDFGADDWYEPFKVLIKGIEEEADLNLMGRLMTRSDLLVALEGRLRVEDTYKRFPEIDDEEIRSPLFILGSGRSGTSVMLNLLSCDPDNGTTTQWESMYPVPPPEPATYHTDPRIAIADKRGTIHTRVAPEINAMHEYGAEIPTELNYIEMMSFLSTGRLNLLGPSKSFQAYIAKIGHVPALLYGKRVLKLLQWKNPRQHWVVKDPDALRFLPDLFEAFPDAQVIWMHRDPFKTIPSVVNLVGTLFWARSDKPMDAKVYAQITSPAGLAGLLDTVIDLIEQGIVPARQIHHVQYLDIVGDPLATIASLYQAMGIEMTTTAKVAMETYMRENPREKRPANKYDVALEHVSEERKLFERYQKVFKIKSEI